MTKHPDRRDILGAAAAAAALAAVPLSARAGQDAALHEIEIKRFKFTPAQLEVRPGDRIRWTNLDNAPHDATADNGGWKVPVMRRGKSAEMTVTADMNGAYFCSIHPRMKAEFVVVTS